VKLLLKIKSSLKLGPWLWNCVIPWVRRIVTDSIFRQQHTLKLNGPPDCTVSNLNKVLRSTTKRRRPTHVYSAQDLMWLIPEALVVCRLTANVQYISLHQRVKVRFKTVASYLGRERFLIFLSVPLSNERNASLWDKDSVATAFRWRDDWKS